MKKIKITVTAVIVLSFFVFNPYLNFAQTTFGAKAGVNLSNLSTENSSDKNMLTGLHAGVFLNKQLSDKFSVQPELLFSQKGSKWKNESGITDSEIKFNLNYIELPVSAVYNLARDFDFQLGPYIGFLLNSKSEGRTTIAGNTIEANKELDKKHFNSADFGLQGGLRFFLKPVYLGFTYKLGLSQVAKRDKLAENILDNAANRTIQVYAAIPF